MKVFLFLAAMLFAVSANAQITQQGTTGIPAPQLSGNGAPGLIYACNAAAANLSYIQLDAKNGRIWLCDTASGSYAWDHQYNPPPGTERVIAKLAGATFSGTSDQVFTIDPAVSTATYQVLQMVMSQPTASLGLSTGGVWTGPGKTGTQLFSFTLIGTSLQGPLSAMTLTPTTAAATAVLPAGTPLYFSLTIALGGANTANINILGYDVQ